MREKEHAATRNEALRSIGVCSQAGIGLTEILFYRCGGSGGLAIGAPHFPGRPEQMLVNLPVS